MNSRVLGAESARNLSAHRIAHELHRAKTACRGSVLVIGLHEPSIAFASNSMIRLLIVVDTYIRPVSVNWRSVPRLKQRLPLWRVLSAEGSRLPRGSLQSYFSRNGGAPCEPAVGDSGIKVAIAKAMRDLLNASGTNKRGV